MSSVCVCSIFMIFSVCFGTLARASEFEFGVVIDAGSSGSRVRIYKWPARLRQQELPDAQQVDSLKIKPGLSSLSEGTPEQIGAHVGQLLKYATDNVPRENHATTAIYFMATAGMRLLPEDTANQMMAEVNSTLGDPSKNPFIYKPSNTRILSGEEEGAFAWISLNDITGFLTEGKGQSSGVLEMGGASAQIAFIPEGSVLANKFPVFLDGKEYQLYVHSYLDFGGTASKNWIFDHMSEQSNSETVRNPCMLKGHSTTYILDPSQAPIQMIGSGNASSCVNAIRHLNYDVGSDYCNPKPCAVGPFYQPSVPEDMDFYAISAFVYTTNDLNKYRPGVIRDDGTLQLGQLNSTTTAYCKEEFDSMVDFFEGPDFVSDRCFKGAYIHSLFTTGFGFSEDTNMIKIAKKVDGLAVSWSLGALIYETQHLPLPGAAISL